MEKSKLDLNPIRDRINEIRRVSETEANHDSDQGPTRMVVQAEINNDIHSRRQKSRPYYLDSPPPPPPASRSYYSAPPRSGRTSHSSSSSSGRESSSSPHAAAHNPRHTDRKDRGRQRKRKKERKYKDRDGSPSSSVPHAETVTTHAHNTSPSRGSTTEHSNDGRKGLERVFLRVVKPIGTLIDKKKRDDPRSLDRARAHLDRVTGASIHAALQEEDAFLTRTVDSDFKSTVLRLLQNVNNRIDTLQNENVQKNTTLIAKSRKLRPNPPHTYPSRNAGEQSWQQAAKQLDTAVKNCERIFPFRENPYDFLLELCGHSNSIASNFGLSEQQQRMLIQASIPNTHPMYSELLMCENLSEIFNFASVNSSAIPTKAETEANLDLWTLDVSSFANLNESIGRLKQLIIDSQQWDYNEGIDQRLLFEMIVSKVKKSTKVPKYVESKLDSFLVDIKNEKSHSTIHELLLGILRNLVISNSQRNLASRPRVHQAEVVATAEVEDPNSKPPPPSSENPNTGARKKNPDRNRQGRARGDNRKYSTSSRNRTRPVAVKPWPANQPYRNKSGTKLYPEIEKWFEGFCFRCGLGSHEAHQCRIYSERTPILTLCCMCWGGFHDVCRHPKTTNRSGAGNQMKKDSSDAVVKKLEALLDRYNQQPPPQQALGFAGYNALPLPFTPTNAQMQPTVKQPHSSCDSD